MIASPHQSVADANGILAKRFFEAQDRLRGGPAPDLCAAGYSATIGSQTLDRAGHEAFSLGFYQAFPDAHHEILDLFAVEDRVAVRFVIHGTHTGSFFGIPASGKPVKVIANVLLTASDGKVTRLAGLFDEAGLLRQMGVLQG